MKLLELFEQPSEIDEMLEFYLGMTQRAQDELKASLLDSLGWQELEPYLGNYQNEVLGEVILKREAKRLLLDVGEFELEIRARSDGTGEVSYTSYSPPLPGFPLTFEKKKREWCLASVKVSSNTTLSEPSRNDCLGSGFAHGSL